MADLRTDIVGRVARLALRPSEKNALMPLMEAVSNSVHSVTDLYASEASSRGRIDIRIVRADRDDQGDLGRVIGFDIEDNGIGFNDENYEAFCTPDTRHKQARGGKGVGRLGWLKVFEKVTIESTYGAQGTWSQRAFEFLLTDRDQVHDLPDQPPAAAHKTVVSFRNFRPTFENRCPIKADAVASRVAAHFVPLFLAGNAPKVFVSDVELTDLEALFTESIADQATKPVKVGEGDEAFEITVWSLKCDKRMRFQPPGYHFAFIAGDARSVVEYSVDEQLGLKALDGDYVT